jgi:hypothetical protein
VFLPRYNTPNNAGVTFSAVANANAIAAAHLFHRDGESNQARNIKVNPAAYRIRFPTVMAKTKGADVHASTVAINTDSGRYLRKNAIVPNRKTSAPIEEHKTAPFKFSGNKPTQ